MVVLGQTLAGSICMNADKKPYVKVQAVWHIRAAGLDALTYPRHCSVLPFWPCLRSVGQLILVCLAWAAALLL